MTIAVNTRILSGNPVAGKFLFDIFRTIAEDNPSHQFIFIAENDLASTFSGSNVKVITIKQQTGNPLLWKVWYNYKLPSVLRKINADVLVSADGICSLRTTTPQCVLVTDIEFIQHPEWYHKKYYRFIKSTITPCLQKATSVITPYERVKNELIDKYKTAEDKIEVIYHGPNKNYQPLHWNAREEVKEKYAAGKEYFLFYGTFGGQSNLTNLLKAFSLFKKRQKSNMQLIISAAALPEKNDFIESLRLYKYRNELKILSGIDENELRSITAAAYCCVNLSPLHTDIIFLQNAMQCEVPLIATNAPQPKEIFEDAALYANPLLFETIAEQLMLIYKDENKRNDLIKKGRERSGKHTLEKTAALFWKNILATARH